MTPIDRNLSERSYAFSIGEYSVTPIVNYAQKSFSDFSIYFKNLFSEKNIGFFSEKVLWLGSSLLNLAYKVCMVIHHLPKVFPLIGLISYNLTPMIYPLLVTAEGVFKKLSTLVIQAARNLTILSIVICAIDLVVQSFNFARIFKLRKIAASGLQNNEDARISLELLKKLYFPEEATKIILKLKEIQLEECLGPYTKNVIKLEIRNIIDNHDKIKAKELFMLILDQTIKMSAVKLISGIALGTTIAASALLLASNPIGNLMILIALGVAIFAFITEIVLRNLLLINEKSSKPCLAR